MKTLFLLIVLCTFLVTDAYGSVVVKAGDTQGLIDAIRQGNQSDANEEDFLIRIVAGDNGETEFVFTMPADGADGAVPNITRNIDISPASGLNITFTTTGDMAGQFRFTTLTGGLFDVRNSIFKGFGTTGDGGAILVEGSAFLKTDKGTKFSNNFAGGNGGAIAVHDEGLVFIFATEFMENHSDKSGGALSGQDSASMTVGATSFSDNTASLSGSAIHVSSSSAFALVALGNVFNSGHGSVFLEDPEGTMALKSNTFIQSDNAIESAAFLRMLGNLLDTDSGGGMQLASDVLPAKIQALCTDLGTDTFESLGYNIAADDSCGLDQDTDLTNTNPMIALNADGFPMPQPGSPAIDSGPTDVIVFEGDDLASLPCGYRDLSGTARPQDANGDGVFECDRGAMEVPGAGEIVAGHSATFFNVDRNGEGNFVEILSDSLAVVYTFTYRPDGSGPAWFVGLGDINGNSIVIDELLRPLGTSFGDDFNASEVDRTPIGGMSMVFPDCEAANPGGNVAYSGEVELGYEALISKATRLSHITGCGAQTPHPNAGLSGSYFDFIRDGEGIIVQWLDNGQVLAIFFTYDQNDNQFWVLGQAAADGKTVTMDALYPSTYTSWGSGFDADDITLSDWGTFTLMLRNDLD